MAELLKAQVEALRRSSAAPTRGFGWFMQQGLGKTFTSLEDFRRKVETREATRKVVLCPNSFKGGWADEVYKQGLGDTFDVHLFESGSRSNRAFVKKEFDRAPILVVNYEAIRSDETQEIIQQFTYGRNAYISADESVQIKGHDSAQTKAAIGLAQYFTFRRLLSGKPAPQGPDDLWSQLRFIGLLSGFGFYPFRYAFCKMGGFKGKKVMGAKEGSEQDLADLMDPHVFWAKKSDWTDLPPKTYTTREYKLDAASAAQYKSMENDFVLWLDGAGIEVAVDIALAKYAKLQQIQCGFVIDEEGKPHELVPPAKNARLQLLLALLRDEVEGKATIPYVNKYVFEILFSALNEAGYNPAYIKGGMTGEEISAQKRKFNGDNSSRVILLQTKAAKYGHTLLGGPESANRCATNIFFQNSYSLDDRDQIEDRNHRHGQTAEQVLNIDLVGTGMDRAAIAALQRKESVFQAIFNYLDR